GLATAYACNSRVLCITGQIPSPLIGGGLGMLHEVRGQSAILGSVSKWQGLARAPGEIPRLVHEAFRQLRSGPPRPVGLELPPDVLAARADMELLAAAAPQPPQDPPAEDLDRVVDRLRRARFPVLVLGGGALAARAGEAALQLAERLQAPIVVTENAKGVVPASHPLVLPALGGRAVFPHADLVLVAGSRFVDGMGRPVHAAPGCGFVYVNLEPAHAGAPRAPGDALCGDATRVLQALADRLEGHRAAESRTGAVAQVLAWCEAQWSFIEPQLQYVKALRRAIPDDGVLVSELTQVGYLANVAYRVQRPGTYLTPGYQGTLGYGFPTAVGTALADPQRVVVSINGDGGFGWGLQELATVARDRPRLVTVVFEDGAFGNVRRIQSTVFGREIGTGLHNPDFVALAGAFGVPALRVDSPEAFESELTAAVRGTGPSVIVAKVGPMPGAWHLVHTFSKVPRPAPPNPLDSAP
ncbi:MAG TPA: thiamine pyrophosphate-dependent enzyme, partial [Ramlibacter sp.]|nr:thiamine pyrophosphate-dependent enzyme [Ramlibacter sp.]